MAANPSCNALSCAVDLAERGAWKVRCANAVYAAARQLAHSSIAGQASAPWNARLPQRKVTSLLNILGCETLCGQTVVRDVLVQMRRRSSNDNLPLERAGHYLRFGPE